ncbi:hypothetical protein B0H13DRAFT_1972934, partial [Mycena leptocephala]
PRLSSTLGAGDLALRWSTPEDKAGCIMLSCLAAMKQEGEESEPVVRYFEPYTDDAFYLGSSTNWAVCVDTSPAGKLETASSDSNSYVVAIVYFLPAEFAFDGDTVRVPVGQARIVACKSAYRPFEMVNARAHAFDCAFMVTAGIVGYYRTHGTPTGTPSLFSLRPATLDDLPALERFVLASRANAEIFTGKRDTPDGPPRVVAAAGLPMYKPGRQTVSVHPLLWDGMEDASAVAQAIVPALISAVAALPTADGSPTTLATLRWTLPDAHPLHRWLLAHELAIPTPESPQYDHMWYIAINSLPRFLAALAPALNARFAGATHIFGVNYSATLHIAAPRAMGGGVVLRVANGVVSVGPANAEQDPKPNLSLPRGALVQLMMGYTGWRELRAVLPDVAVESGVVPLVDVLFPKRQMGSAIYI